MRERGERGRGEGEACCGRDGGIAESGGERKGEKGNARQARVVKVVISTVDIVEANGNHG